METIITAQCNTLTQLTEQIRFYGEGADADQDTVTRLAEIVRQAAILLLDMATPKD